MCSTTILWRIGTLANVRAARKLVVSSISQNEIVVHAQYSPLTHGLNWRVLEVILKFGYKLYVIDPNYQLPPYPTIRINCFLTTMSCVLYLKRRSVFRYINNILFCSISGETYVYICLLEKEKKTDFNFIDKYTTSVDEKN